MSDSYTREMFAAIEQEVKPLIAERDALFAMCMDQSQLLMDIENWLRREVVKEPDRTFFWKIVELRRKHGKTEHS